MLFFSSSLPAAGMRVSYPQYVRLVALQEKVIKLDLVMRRMQSQVPRDELENVPKWHTLLALHDSLKKMLPPEYTARYDRSNKKRRSFSADSPAEFTYIDEKR